MRVQDSLLREYLTNPRYRDRWVRLSAPNTKGELKGLDLFGLMSGTTFSDNLSMKSTENSLGGVASQLQTNTQVDEAISKGSVLVADYLTYEGANNNTIPLTMLVVPDINKNPNMDELIAIQNKLIRPKPYSRSVLYLDAFRYNSYFPELDRTKTFIEGIKENLEAVVQLTNKEDVTTEWGEKFLHLNIGDNINMTGLIVSDIDIEWSLLRDTEGQFYAMTLAMSLAPYRTPDAVTASGFYTGKNAWSKK